MNEDNIYSTEALIAAIVEGFHPKYLCFWGHHPRPDGQIGKQCLSQWWVSSFEVNGILYPTAEHYMMAEEARLFGDELTAEKILSASHPEVAKKLGREAKGFDEAKWVEHRFEIVVRGNEAKFGQNAELKQFLLTTGQRVLVEASPVDRMWGIGLAEDNPKAANPEQWRGLNLLGFALMKVRSRLVSKKAA
ncbi:MAG: NADAR family protein [Anaerolineae bacterium]|nr:NADAR family protein [Anaerolineae bacterium]